MTAITMFGPSFRLSLLFYLSHAFFFRSVLLFLRPLFEFQLNCTKRVFITHCVGPWVGIGSGCSNWWLYLCHCMQL